MTLTGCAISNSFVMFFLSQVQGEFNASCDVAGAVVESV